MADEAFIGRSPRRLVGGVAAVAATSVSAASLRRFGVRGQRAGEDRRRARPDGGDDVLGRVGDEHLLCVVRVTTVSGVESMATIRSGLR